MSEAAASSRAPAALAHGAAGTPVMRILCLSTWFPYPPDNGAKLRAHYLIRALSTAHTVTLIAFRPPQPVQPPIATKPVEGIEIHVVEDDPFKHVHQPSVITFLSPSPVAYWPNPLLRKTIERVAGPRPWDAVVVLQENVAREVDRFPQAAKILDIDTALSFQMRERHGQAEGRLARWRAWISWQKAYQWDRRTFRRYQACTVALNTEIPYVADMVRGRACRIEVVTNGVDCERNQPGLSAGQPDTLIYTGAITYPANYDAVQYFISEIYPRVQQQRPQASFTVTGSTEGVDRSRLTVDESVHFSGYVDDIRSTVSRHAVCVVPLREGSGTRLKILEAMALGVPIVSTPKGAEGLDVAHGEHLLIADEPATFAAAVVRLLTDDELRHQLTTNARRRVEERYDWKSIGQQFVALVEDAVERKRR
jgi:glycosyltransferase involved in cell wall biosynthesis